jgi:two-component system phosphate regulon sensor histidine kinase PhoR
MDDEDVDMPALLARVLAQGEAVSAGRHRLRLTCVETHLSGSPFELESAIGNLVSNAVRYTPEDGEIAIDWRVVDGKGVLTVRDTGIGIAAEHIPRLTERFYRVDKGRSRDSGGTGLGLAIVKHIALRHQAELRIESTPGEGSRFSLVFPAARLR